MKTLGWIIAAFVAGFVATLAFHQGLFAALHALGATPIPAYDMSATPPLGVPRVISLAFWGGVWGIALWPLLRRYGGVKQLIACIVAGAIGPSLVALAVVFPLKQGHFGALTDPKLIVAALLLNGAWGLGVYIVMRLLHRWS